MSARLYEPVDRNLSAQEQWPQRLPQPGESQAQPIAIDTSSDDDSDTDPPELARDREANDARLKNRFEAIFDKYGRDFTGVGDEIDLETGEIVVDNGHLENMQDEADAGDGEDAPTQFAHAFAENLKQEELSSSEYESDADEDADQSEDAASDEEDVSEDVNNSIFSVREQSTESNTSPVEPDNEPINPRLAQLASAMPSASLVVPSVEGNGQSSTTNSARPLSSRQNGSGSGNTSQSGTPGLDVMGLPEVQETMLALKTQTNNGGRAMDDTAIAALGKSIASQIARFMKGPNSKGKQKKRKDAAWEYPELPEDKRRRLGTPPPVPSRPRLESLKSAISPGKTAESTRTTQRPRAKGKGKERAKPLGSLWAPVSHPQMRKPRKTKKRAEAPPAGSSLDDPEAIATVDEIQDDRAPIQRKQCSNCEAIATITWRKAPDGSDMCNACGMYLYRYGLMKPPRPPTPEPAPPKPKKSAANTSKRVVPPPKEGARHSKFTLQEDALVIKLKEFDNLNWEKIGRHFEGRSSFAVQCRYSKILLGGAREEGTKAREALVEQGFDFEQLERGKNGGLSKKEDELLLQLCPVPPPSRDAAETDGPIEVDDNETSPDPDADSGPDFSAIAAEHFPNLTPQVLQDRYVYHLERYVEAKDSNAKKKGQSKLGGPPRRKPISSSLSRGTGVFFTPEENERLVQYREVDPISWEAILQKFPGRSGMSIQKRYTRELGQRKAIVAKGGKDPYAHLFKHGILSAIDKDATVQESRKQMLKVMETCRFSRMEDERIVRLRQEQKLGWDKMAAHFSERTPEHLQQRYEYLQAKLVKPAGSGGLVEDPSIYDIPISDSPQRPEASTVTDGDDAAGAANAGEQLPKLKGPRKAKTTKYSKAEDKLILKLHFDQGLNWEQISTHLPGRTAEQIERRFNKKLLPDHGNYEPDDSSDIEESDGEELAHDGSGNPDAIDVEALEDRQPEYLWQQHAGALPDAEIPGLEDLSDGELGPSSAFFAGDLKRHLQNNKAGSFSRQQRYSKREEEKLIQLRREGLNWEALTSEFPGKTAYELACYWHQHLKPSHKARSIVTTTSSRTSGSTKTDDTGCFVAGTKAANLFTLLAKGGTALLVADEIPITASIAKSKKAQDKTFEAANAKRKGTGKKLSRRQKLLPSALSQCKWLNQDGEETVVPSIEPHDCLMKLRDGTLVQQFSDPTPEIHGWGDSDDEESGDEFFSAAEQRSVSPVEYDETGFAILDDDAVESEAEADRPAQNQPPQNQPPQNQPPQNQPVVIDVDEVVELEDPDVDESEDDADDVWRPGRHSRRSTGAPKRGRKSTASSSNKRKASKRTTKRPSKRSRTVRDTETPESIIEIKDESEDERPASERNQEEIYEPAPGSLPDHPQTPPPADMRGENGMEQDLFGNDAQHDSPVVTPTQPSSVTHPSYDTPARYDQQSHPYYAAPVARMYSPIREEHPTEHEIATDIMEIDPALLGDASGAPPVMSSEQDRPISAANMSGGLNVSDPQSLTSEEANAMDLDDDDEYRPRSTRQRASEEPTPATRRSTRGRSAPRSPEPALMSSAANPPPFSWNELVTMALKSIPSQRLSTNGIYLFLQDKFPYFETCNAQWKKALQVFLSRSSDFKQSAETRGEDSWTFASQVVKVPERSQPTPRRSKEVTVEVTDAREREEDSLFVGPAPEPEPAPVQEFEALAPSEDAVDAPDTISARLDSRKPDNYLAQATRSDKVIRESSAIVYRRPITARSRMGIKPRKRPVPRSARAPAPGAQYMLETPRISEPSAISSLPERKRRGRPRKSGPRPPLPIVKIEEESELGSPGMQATDAIDPALSDAPPTMLPAPQRPRDVGESSSGPVRLDHDSVVRNFSPAIARSTPMRAPAQPARALAAQSTRAAPRSVPWHMLRPPTTPAGAMQLDGAADVPVLVQSSAFSRAGTRAPSQAQGSDIFRDPQSSSSNAAGMSAAKNFTSSLVSAAMTRSTRTPASSSPAPLTIFDRLASYSNKPKPAPAPRNVGLELFNRHENNKAPQRAASQAPVQYSSRVGRAGTSGTGRAVTPSAARASSVGLGSVNARRAIASEGTPLSRRVVETPPPRREADSEEDELA